MPDPTQADLDGSWPSQQRRASSDPTRRDGRRSRDVLLQAAGRLLATAEDFTLKDVAAAAGLSTATAYRHFRSAEDIAQAFIAGFLDDVEHRTVAAAPAEDVDAAVARLRYVNTIWVQTVLDWGPALAHLRSPDGFLARRRRKEPDVTRSLAHIEPAIKALLTCAAGRPPRADELSYIVSVWNALSDPREVVDLSTTLGWSSRRIIEHLQGSLIAITVDRSRWRGG
jgi:AcrR family transcriptional regulator